MHAEEIAGRPVDTNDGISAQVIQALQIGDYMQHKARDPEALTTWSPLPRMHRAQIAPRNPARWAGTQFVQSVPKSMSDPFPIAWELQVQSYRLLKP